MTSTNEFNELPDLYPLSKLMPCASSAAWLVFRYRASIRSQIRTNPIHLLFAGGTKRHSLYNSRDAHREDVLRRCYTATKD